MTTVFVDTLYWIAVTKPQDSWAASARKARLELLDVVLVTTDEVLGEFLAALSRGGPSLRRKAVAMVRQIMSHPDVRVVPQSRGSFLAGLALYEQRPDKGYSLVDCISMVVMRQEGIAEALSNDGHFRQEGFQVLIGGAGD